MNRKHEMMFLDAPEDGGGGGGTALEAMGPIETPAAGGEQPASPQPQAQPQAQAQTPAPASFDAKALAHEFGSVLREHLPQQGGPQPQAQLTPEEAKKLLNFFEIDDDFLKEFGNIETQKNALVKMRDGITKHIVTVMQARNQEIMEQMQQRYDPYVQSFERAEGERRQARFGESFPQLAAPALLPVVNAVANSFRAEGKTFTDEKSMFDAIAKGVEAVIQQTNPAFKLTAASAAASTTTTKNQAPASAIPVTTPGVGGGGGQGPAPAQTGPKALGFLGKVR